MRSTELAAPLDASRGKGAYERCFRVVVLRAVLLAGLAAMSVAPAVRAQIEAREFDIPAQPLASALLEFSRQSDSLIFFSPEVAEGKRSRHLRAAMRVDDAIAELLRDTQLRAVPNPKGGYRVERIAPDRSSRPPETRMTPRQPVPEIIVTAQKRTERLQDTPVPVTALDTSQLIQRNLTRLQDYFAEVPGLSLNAEGNGKANIILRGISTGVFGNPTVAVSIDDVPYGSSTALADGQLVQPDLDPADLERIEVLRGPQGTLYGASSLGGLIKYVTKDPSTDRMSGRAQSDVTTVHEGEVGYGVRGALNLPLGETTALRVSAYSRRSPGWVDNVVTGEKDVNTIDVAGGRVGLLFEPIDALTIRLGVIHQDTRGEGSSRVTTDYLLRPTVGELDQSLLPDSGAFDTRSTLLTANIKLDLGDIHIESVTGYGRNRNREVSDSSDLVAAIAPVSELFSNMRTSKLTQELRFSSLMGRRVEWRLGGFYAKENSGSFQAFDQIDPVTGAKVSNLLTADFPTTYEELAAFGEMNYRFMPEFNFQAGLRYSRNWQTYAETDTGPLGEVAPGVSFITSTRSSDDALTFLLVPQYEFSPRLMAYLRVASGYRPGGPNGSAALFDLPPSFDADTTLNYELGLKGNALDARFSFDIAVFYIDWHRVQVRIHDPDTQLFSYFTNGGEADSRGVEATFSYRAPQGLRLSVTGGYNHARFSQTPPPGVGAQRGDRLPFGAKLSGSLSADQDIVLTDEYSASAGATIAYVGERAGPFPQRPGSMRIQFPGFFRLDLRAGFRKDHWIIGVFARNVTDERGVLSATSQTAHTLVTSTYGTHFIPPRTLGFYLERSF